MARETIFPSTPAQRIVEIIKGEPRETDQTDWRHCPQVLWSREQSHVQVGVVPEHQPEAQDDEWPALYTACLDRNQINRLIATLRRARDAAYGKDE